MNGVAQHAKPVNGMAPALLAKIPLPAIAWTGPVAQALRKLLAAPPTSAEVFRRCLAYSSLYGHRLTRAASTSRVSTKGLVADYPLACTLLQLRPGQPLAQTLGWFLLELHLEQVHLDDAGALAANLRGFLGGADDHPMRLTLGDVDGLPHLLAKMEALEARSSRSGEITGLSDFDRNWRRKLKATCLDLVRSVDWDDRTRDPEHDAASPLDDPVASIPSPVGPVDLEEPAGLSFFSFAPNPAAASAAAIFTNLAVRWTQSLQRRSSAELHRHWDSILPTALVRTERAHQLDAVSKALDRGDAVQAQKHLLHLLAIETGLSDRESRSAAIARDTRNAITVLDLRNRCLRRVELRPPAAYCPEGSSDMWLPTGGDLIFPISPETARVAVRLQRLRCREKRAGGDWNVASHLLVDADLAELAFPVRDAIRETRSCRVVTGGAYRLRLATIVAQQLGTDAAQIAFGDSFGISSASTYYSAFSAKEIALCVTSHWVPLGWSASPHARALSCGAHIVGSRVRPANPPFGEAWSMFAEPTRRKRGRPSVDGMEARWIKLRDALATRLLVATGARPTEALAQLRLGDFIPDAALVVLQDKASDPAHATRLACTGFNFLNALQAFLTELRRWTRVAGSPTARQLAVKILAGEAPLFDVPSPDGRIDALEVSTLIARMPAPWRDKPNLHRHALCQALIRFGVDPESRFFQMGWIVAGAHATSDECPRRPLDLGLELAPTIDAWMAEIGWGAVHYDRRGVSLSLRSRDWTAVAKDHGNAADARRKELRTTLRERRREERPGVLAKLATRMREVAPSLHLQESMHGVRILARGGSQQSDPPTIGPAVVAQILQPFSEPMHQHIARIELARTLSAANRELLCKATLPQVSSVALSMVPSSIVLGVGGAVEDCNRLRRALFDRVGRAEADASPQELAAMLVWAIACHSPYRRIEDAVAIAKNAPGATQSNAERWIVRVPLGTGHVVLSGAPALLILRTFNAARKDQVHVDMDVLDIDRLGAELKAIGAIPESMAVASDREAARWMEAALLLAGEVELPGPDRLVMRREALPATVTAERAASAAEGLSLPSATDSANRVEDEGEDLDAIPTFSIPNPTHRPTRNIRDVMALLDHEGPSRSDGSRGDRKNRMRDIRQVLSDRIKAFGYRATVPSIFLRYAEHRLFPEVGGRGIAPATMGKIYGRLSPLFAMFDASREMSELDPDELTGALLAALWRCRRRDKADVYSELERFLRFAMRTGVLAEPDWSILRGAAGLPFVATDPGIVSDAEARRVLEQLSSNLDSDRDSMLEPRERRIREVQLMAFLIGEGVGARPRSIHGLALADLRFDQDGDWIHLHSRGRFASIKTPTSAGFIQLEGELWDSCAAWARQWKQDVLQLFPKVAAHEIPLFQVPGEPLGVRYRMSEVFGRIGDLIRWSTQQRNGRAYWLRKRRVQHRTSCWRRNPGSRTRDVLRAMRDSGHVSLATSIVSYLADTLCFIDPLPAVAAMSSREAAAASGLSVNVVEQRWKRARSSDSTPSASQHGRMGTLLRRELNRWVAPAVGDPPPYRPLTIDFGARAVEEILNAAANNVPPERISQVTAASTFSVERVLRAAKSLEIRTGLVFGTSPGELHRPRATTIAQAILALLDARDGRLPTIAREWVGLARARPAEHGCVLFEGKAISAFQTIAADAGIRAEAETNADGSCRLRLREPGGEIAYGGWIGLRWVLAVAWTASEASGFRER